MCGLLCPSRTSERGWVLVASAKRKICFGTFRCGGRDQHHSVGRGEQGKSAAVGTVKLAAVSRAMSGGAAFVSLRAQEVADDDSDRVEDQDDVPSFVCQVTPGDEVASLRFDDTHNDSDAEGDAMLRR